MRILIGIGLFVVVAFQACGKANFSGSGSESKEADSSSSASSIPGGSGASVAAGIPGTNTTLNVSGNPAVPGTPTNTTVVCDPFSNGTCATGSTVPTTGAGLIGHVYFLPNGSEVAQYLSRGQRLPITVILSNLNVPDRAWTYGFPGADGTSLKEPDGTDLNEWFMLDLNGNFTLPNSMPEGPYEFATNSDDGSLLYVNNVIVVQNDGTHSQKVAGCNIPVNLKHGVANTMKLDYFQGPRTEIACRFTFGRLIRLTIVVR